ncbi:TPM domain-containing protein [Bifidobacterium adolescentis]|uniref:TPM domain-containing protein n=1 Tax=Bifidobacterium adolescentis TaxID=1680 RepID=UPI003B9B2760
MLLASVLGLCLMLWITPPVHADDSAGLGITATDDITDTQNLLGSNVSEITDAINRTKKETGVTVRLVYLDSFNAKGKPDKWVSALLESLNPKPNTVMLAVASNDGNLVVAVSSNSEEWLKKKSTVDALSDAAQKPLMESDPDWAKSATDMMNQISVQKKTSTSSRTIWIGVGGFAGALLLLVVILVVFHILRKKGVIGHRRKGRHSGRHGAVAERIQPVKEWGAESENEDYVNPDTASTQDSESVQETSSEGSDA